MTANKPFVFDKEKGVINELSDGGRIKSTYYSVEEVVDKLNEEYGLEQHFARKCGKLSELLKEVVKPTANVGGDVYLSLDENQKCKYEHTIICNDCEYFSDYFLDCRLMFEDYQYRKALELGLVKK